MPKKAICRKEGGMNALIETRSDIVERFKREIKDKTYKVKSGEIADKIAQKLREDETVPSPAKRNKWMA
jgi:anti-sigma28 factor (negative regulator of flagellin synthesis)